MEPCCRLSTVPVELKFYGDFEISISLKSVGGFSPKQLTLLESILGSPNVKLQLARMALETDLNSLMDSHFRDRYSGPQRPRFVGCCAAVLATSGANLLGIVAAWARGYTA